MPPSRTTRRFFLLIEGGRVCDHAVRSRLVIEGGSSCCSTAPRSVFFAYSALSSAPISMANPVQYSHTIRATAAPSVPYVLLKFAKPRK